MTTHAVRRRGVALVIALSLLGAAAPVASACPAVPVQVCVQPSASASAGAPEADAVRRLFDLLNDERERRGLPRVAHRDDVHAIARDHSRAMASEQRLRHNDAYFSPAAKHRLRARTQGENVAVGATIDEIHQALMRSDGHRANVLRGRFTVVGLGAAWDGRAWWVTEDFLEPS